MSMLREKIDNTGHKHYLEYFFPMLIIVVGIISTILFARATFEAEHLVVDKTLTRTVDETENIILSKIDQYDLLARAIEGLFVSSESVTRYEYHNFVANEINQSETFSEVSTSGFFRRVTRENLEKFIAVELADQTLSQLGFEFEDIVVFPESERDVLYATTHIEPYDVLENFLGYDFTNEPVRTAAVTSARNTGLLTLTDQIDLRPLMIPGYVAVYPIEKDSVTEEIGMGYFVFRAEEMIKNLLQERQFNNVDLIVYDQKFPGNTFFATEEGLEQGSFMGNNYVERRIIPFANQNFVIKAQIKTYPFFYTTLLVIAFGILSTGILAVLALYLVRSKILITHREQITSKILKKAQNRFIGAFNASSIGMALVALDGHWLEVNKALAEMIGYSQQELTGMNFQQITHPEDLDKDLDLLQQVIDDEIQTYQMEKRYLHKRGNIVWTILSVSVVRNEDRSVDYFVSQIINITEQKDQERSKQDFISITSHQLRTPLTAVSWNMELLRPSLEKGLNESEKNLLTAVVTSTKRMIDLVNALLSTSRIEMDRIHINPASLDFKKMINGIVEDVRSANEDGVTINLQIVDLPKLFYDEKVLTMIFQNLIANAAKFSPEKGIVNVAVTKENSRLITEIKDNGIGIPDSEKGKVFDKFFRAENAKTEGVDGTGLGLYIVKAMVEKIGGVITFVSVEGKGTTFTVSLPLETIEENQSV